MWEHCTFRWNIVRKSYTCFSCSISLTALHLQLPISHPLVQLTVQNPRSRADAHRSLHRGSLRARVAGVSTPSLLFGSSPVFLVPDFLSRSHLRPFASRQRPSAEDFSRAVRCSRSMMGCSSELSREALPLLFLLYKLPPAKECIGFSPWLFAQTNCFPEMSLRPKNLFLQNATARRIFTGRPSVVLPSRTKPCFRKVGICHVVLFEISKWPGWLTTFRKCADRRHPLPAGFRNMDMSEMFLTSLSFWVVDWVSICDSSKGKLCDALGGEPR